ncbi:MAG: hypothetical protein AB7T27_11505 [Kiritimatiellia bacterium]
MNTHWPDYPLGPDGQIPEPLCYDVLMVWAEEWCCAYMWDMNGLPVYVEELEGHNKELDQEFDDWQYRLTCQPVNEDHDRVWKSEEDRLAYDREGMELARKLYEYFQRKKTVIYRSTKLEKTWMDAEGKPRPRFEE